MMFTFAQHPIWAFAEYVTPPTYDRLCHHYDFVLFAPLAVYAHTQRLPGVQETWFHLDAKTLLVTLSSDAAYDPASARRVWEDVLYELSAFMSGAGQLCAEWGAAIEEAFEKVYGDLTN